MFHPGQTAKPIGQHLSRFRLRPADGPIDPVWPLLGISLAQHMGISIEKPRASQLIQVCHDGYQFDPVTPCLANYFRIQSSLPPTLPVHGQGRGMDFQEV